MRPLHYGVDDEAPGARPFCFLLPQPRARGKAGSDERSHISVHTFGVIGWSKRRPPDDEHRQLRRGHSFNGLRREGV